MSLTHSNSPSGLSLPMYEILSPSTAGEFVSELLVDRLISILEANEELIEKAING